MLRAAKHACPLHRVMGSAIASIGCLMRFKLTTAWWMGTAFGAAACLAAIVLAVFGTNERGTDIALQATARWSFLLFWGGYTGSAMATLFGPNFQAIKRHGRDFGLAFASAHLVHVALIAWLCWIGAAPATGTFVFFGIALVGTYLLALLSIRRLQQMLSRTSWWWTRTVCMNYIAYAFAVDFWKHPLQGEAKHIVVYLPFAILSVAGPILVFASFALPTVRLGRARLGRVWPWRERHRHPAAR